MDIFKKENIISLGRTSAVYKGIETNIKQYVAIKEISKTENKNLKHSNLRKKFIEKLYSLKNSLRGMIDSEEYLFIIMDLCLCNLEEYIKMRKDNLSIEEIREILIQLNESLKLMIKEDIIYRDLKPQNILINLEKINKKCVIQLSGFVSYLINNINK